MILFAPDPSGFQNLAGLLLYNLLPDPLGFQNLTGLLFILIDNIDNLTPDPSSSTPARSLPSHQVSSRVIYGPAPGLFLQGM